MGVVYLAEDRRLGRPVALKTMTPDLAGDASLLKRFYREAQSAGQLRHPNIVTIYDIDEADGIPFIAMEFLEGDSLEKIIDSRRELPIARKLDIIVQICHGLHYAHERGVVHRDIKPANIVVLQDGMIKIVDFGIARIGGMTMTQKGLVMGTPAFMSPEQILGNPVDGRSDIFSVGIILYTFLTFQNPFAGEHVSTVLYKITSETPEPIRTLIPNCPPELDSIIQKALAKRREERYQTAEDMAFDLQRVADSMSRDMVEIYVREGQKSFAEGNLTLAKESLQRVLEVDSDHNLAKGLLDQVQGAILAKQRQQKIEQDLNHAREAVEAQQFDEALECLDEILRVDAAHAEAQQLKQFALDWRERMRKIHQHLKRAEQFQAEANFAGARTQLESVLALDPQHAEALRQLESVLKEIAEQERLRQVRQNIESARKHLADKNYARAIQLLEESLQLDRFNIEAESLIQLARSGQEKEKRRQLLEQRIAGIQAAIDREEYEAATQHAEEALAEFPEDPQVLKLHAQASRLTDTQKRRRFVDEQVQAARDSLQQNDFSTAVTILERAIDAAPADARLTSYLKTVRETEQQAQLEAIRQEAVREAKEKIRSKDFASAIRILEQALGRVGQSEELAEFMQLAREQQADQQKQDRVREVLLSAQKSLSEERFQEAVQTLERASQELPDREIDNWLETARQQLEKFNQQRVGILKRARELLKSGEATKALSQLEAAPRVFLESPEFRQIQAECNEGVRRASEIRTTLDHFEKYRSERDFEHARLVLDHALQTYPEEPSLESALRRLVAEETRVRREQWKALIEEAKDHLHRRQFPLAIATLKSVDWSTVDDVEMAQEGPKLLDVAQRLQADQVHLETVRVSPIPEADEPETISVPAPPEKFRESRQASRPGPSIDKTAETQLIVQSSKPASTASRSAPPEPVIPETRIAPAGIRQVSTPSPPPAVREPLVRVRPRVAAASDGLAPDASQPASASIAAPEAPPVAPPSAAPPPPVPRPSPKVPVAPPRPAPRAPSVPLPVARAAPAKGRPIGLWLAVGVLALAIIGIVIWRLTTTPVAATGYAQITTTPWAQVVSVRTEDGHEVALKGTGAVATPVQLELPPGKYVIELSNQTTTEKVEVSIKAGENSPVYFAFPRTNVKSWVNELINEN